MKKVISYTNQFLINGDNPMPKFKEGEGSLFRNSNDIYEWAVEASAIYMKRTESEKELSKLTRQDSFSSSSRSSNQSPIDNILEYDTLMWGEDGDNHGIQEKMTRARKYNKGKR